jgi:hypothetical protein
MGCVVSGRLPADAAPAELADVPPEELAETMLSSRTGSRLRVDAAVRPLPPDMQVD